VAAANPAAATLLGRESVGRWLDQLPAAQGTYGLAAHLSLCLKAGTAATYEQSVRGDRGERHFHVTLTPLWDRDGRLFRIMVVARDVTVDKAPPRFGMLELALDRMRQAVYLLDDDGYIRYASAEALRALGYTRAELTGMHVTELDPEWDAARWDAATRELREHGSFQASGRHRRQDGTTFPVEIECSQVLWEGEMCRVAVVQEITHRLTADEELRTRAESFRALAEHSSDVLIRYDRDCRRIYANPSLLRLATAAPQDLIGKTPTETSPVVTEPPLYEATLREVLATGEPREKLFRVKTARGDFWHHALFVPERDARGEIAGVLGIGHDVTPLLDAQQALRRRNRELRTLGKCRQSLIHATDEHDLLEQTCRILCEETGYHLAWIGDAAHDPEKTLRPVAWAGPDSAYLAGLRLSWADDYAGAHCVAGLAIRAGRPVTVQEFETDPRMAEARADALRHGYRSGVALPLAGRDGVFGVLVICSAEPDALSPDELHLLEELAQEVAYGLVALRERARRERAEQALRENEQKYRDMFQNAPLGLFRLGFDGRFQDVNPAFAAMFGYDSPAAMISDVVHIAAQIYASPDSHTTSVASLLAAPDTTRHQTRFRSKDGSEFTGRLFLKTIRNARGVPLFLEGIVEDISASLRSEEQLRLLTFALNHVRDEVYLINDEGSLEYVNDGAVRALGYSRDQLLRMSVPAIDPGFTLEQWHTHWNELRARGGYTFDGTHRTREGRLYPVEIAANFFEYDGRSYNLALARDISERRQAEQALRRLNRALATFSSGNEALVRARSESELLEQMCRVVVEAGNYHFVWIGFAQPDGTIIPAAWAGKEQGFLTVRQQFCAKDPVCDSVRSGTARIIHRLAELELPAPFHAELVRCGFRSCAALPLIEGDEIGVLAIYSAEDDAFDADEVRLLTEMSHDLAYGIRALRLRVDREKSEARLRASMESTIEALSSTVELRDPYTAGHQRRVARLAARVARALQWTEERIQAIYLAGMVHDVGKMAVPAEILSKPGRLTEAEMALVRAHAEAGFEILKPIDFPWPIARIVHQHHERLDGSGYPLGLKGDEICIEARILAVCDVVEAMTSHRPYRAKLGLEKALAVIEEGRGSQFDAAVVEVCTGLLRNHAPAPE
jgi:PAS domain S-box-containing protein/putative nucleotidyltransferase with HDIG domain